ncbi:MAG: sulfatase [Myxococcales bacterium]|nr:sulfatase [Myxococcales bacterium]
MKLVGSAAGGTVEVSTQLDGGKPSRLGGGGALSLPLDPVAGKAVRVMLRGKGGAVKLTGGKLDGGVAKKPAIAKPKYVVVWLIDTLRADKLPFYRVPNANGRPKVETPNLAALAKEALVFEPYWVQGNESKASHASLFTSTYPVVHRVYTQEANLPDKLTTIAEVFKKAGYKTGGYCSNGYVSDRWNFDQGFAKGDFRNFIREGGANNAKAIVKAAKGFIDANKGKPFYLYLGTSDPHVTYRAHKEFIGKYDTGGEYTGRYKKALSGEELGKIKGQKNPPGERDRKRIEALYENEIAFNDKHFGEVIAHLKAAGIYDETLIIVTSDHGDEFWEHGSAGHGHSLHQELVNVPMMIRFPGVLGGKRAEFGMDGVDLLPLLADIVGQPRPDDAQGLDVLPLIGAEGAIYPRATIASMGTGSYALQVGPAKVIMRSERSITAYDTKADPAEKSDVFGDKVVLSMAAMDPLSLFLSRAAKWDKAKWGAPNNLTRGALR